MPKRKNADRRSALHASGIVALTVSAFTARASRMTGKTEDDTEDTPDDKTLGMTIQRSTRLLCQPISRERLIMPRNSLDFSNPVGGGSTSGIVAAVRSAPALARKIVT